MRRVLLILSTLGILAVAASTALADHGNHHGYRHGGFYAPAYVHPRVWVAPPVVMPYGGYPVVVPAPVYRYRPYYPEVQSGFYYRGPGVSIGVGF